MDKKRKQITLTLTPDLLAWINTESNSVGVNRSAFISMILNAEKKNSERKEKRVVEA